LSPTFSLISFTVPAAGSGHFHGGLVGLQGDERVLRLHRVAGTDFYADHRHVLEIADVGNLDFDELACRFLRR
jgi:hypothetical protein